MNKYRSIGIIYSKKEFYDIEKIAKEHGFYILYSSTYFSLLENIINVNPDFLLMDTDLGVYSDIANSFKEYLSDHSVIRFISDNKNFDVCIAGLIKPEEYNSFFIEMNKNIIIREKTKYKISSIEVSSFLKNIGFSTKRVGFNYIKDAIALTINEGGNIKELKKYIFPQIARKYNCSIETIDKNISRIIESTYTSETKIRWSNILSTSTLDKYPPTSKEFITLVIDFLIDKRY